MSGVGSSYSIGGYCRAYVGCQTSDTARQGSNRLVTALPTLGLRIGGIIIRALCGPELGKLKWASSFICFTVALATCQIPNFWWPVMNCRFAGHFCWQASHLSVSGWLEGAGRNRHVWGARTSALLLAFFLAVLLTHRYLGSGTCDGLLFLLHTII